MVAPPGILNSQQLASVNFDRLPAGFKVFASVDSSNAPALKEVAFVDNSKLEKTVKKVDLESVANVAAGDVSKPAETKKKVKLVPKPPSGPPPPSAFAK